MDCICREGAMLFNSIYWNKIDQSLLGQMDNVEDAWRERLDHLSDEEKDKMKKMVAKKVRDGK